MHDLQVSSPTSRVQDLNFLMLQVDAPTGNWNTPRDNLWSIERVTLLMDYIKYARDFLKVQVITTASGYYKLNKDVFAQVTFIF
jgi:hypothetical protein